MTLKLHNSIPKDPYAKQLWRAYHFMHILIHKQIQLEAFDHQKYAESLLDSGHPCCIYYGDPMFIRPKR